MTTKIKNRFKIRNGFDIIYSFDFKKKRKFSDARSITVGFLGVLFPLSCVEEPLTFPIAIGTLRPGTLALTKEKITGLAKHDTY